MGVRSWFSLAVGWVVGVKVVASLYGYGTEVRVAEK